MATTTPCAPGNCIPTWTHQPDKNHLPILHASKNWSKTIRNPSLVMYRWPNDLRVFLVFSTLTTPAPSTNTANNKINVTANVVSAVKKWWKATHSKARSQGESTKFEAKVSRKTINLSHSTVREMENVLHVMMNGHCSNIRTRTTVAAHFCQPKSHFGGSASKGDWKDPPEQHTVEKRDRVSGSSPSKGCLHMGWVWMSDITVCRHSVQVTAYANTASVLYSVQHCMPEEGPTGLKLCALKYWYDYSFANNLL